MTHFKKVLGGLTVVGLLAAAPAYAIPALTFSSSFGTQTVDPFSGIDWIDTATAVTSGFNVIGDTITTSYLATATAIKTGPSNAFLPGLTANGTPSNAFEFTIKAVITETASCGNLGCTQVNFTATGGTFEIYYDSTADADRSQGIGFVNGTKIIGGTINASALGAAGSFTGDGTGLNGTGNFNFFGTVTFTETDSTKDAWISPALAASNAVATLQLGTNLTGGWTRPTAFQDAGFASLPGSNTPDLIVFQADGTQAFAVVPEPGTVALLGLGLIGIAGGTWRRKS